MNSISGKLRAGEARGAVATIGARQRGSVLIYYAALFACIVIGAIIEGIADHFSDNRFSFTAIGFVFGAVVYLIGGRFATLRIFKQRMRARHLPVDFSLEMYVSGDALSYRTGPIRKTCEWNGVTELFRAKEFWVFLVHMEPWFGPRRFFANETEEKAFLREALSKMGPDAQGRSKAAAMFAS